VADAWLGHYGWRRLELKARSDGWTSCRSTADDLGDIANLDLTLAEGQLVLVGLQRRFVVGQTKDHAIVCSLSADDPRRAAEEALIVEEVERLHWRLWNGEAKDAQISTDRIRFEMHHFQGKAGGRLRKSREPRLQVLDGYLTGQSDWMVNCPERHRAGLGIDTVITENGPFAGDPPDEQIAVNALDSAKRRSFGSGSMRCLRWHAHLRFRTEVPAR
jgi:hypothetical protein